MRCRTMLLGGAVALALSGAAYAQDQQSAPQATPGTDNAGAAAGTQTTTGNDATATSTTKTTMHHHGHHYYGHHHGHHYAKTASSKSEKHTTRMLNMQQVMGSNVGGSNMGGGTLQNTSTGGGTGPQQTGTDKVTGAPATPPTTPADYTAPAAQSGTSAPPAAAPPAAAPPAATQPAGNGGNAPTNATYTQPQGAQSPNGYQTVPQDNEPGSYMSAPGASGPVGSQGNPVTPSDQKGPTTPDNSSNPGPSN